MKNLFRILLAAILVSAGCTSPAPSLDEEIRSIENGLMKAVVVRGDSVSTYSIQERMERFHVPGMSIAVVRKGKIRWAKGYGMANTETGSPVGTGTLFQAGSISKPVAALAALRLVQEGKLDLDTDVNRYLKDWKVEENEYTKEEKVTLRRLLTHTAGTTVHGFPGYSQTDTFPTLVQVLNGEGNTPPVRVDTTPGFVWRYSGGGYEIMEKVVEDVSGLPLEQYMRQYILDPLDMNNSTYRQPLPRKFRGQASAAYDSEGRIIEGWWHNYPEQAAAGLWTTPTDLAKYCIAVQQMLAGKPGGILSRKTVEQMLTKHQNGWGLGLSLSGEGDFLIFGHGGKNAGFTDNMNAFAYLGDGLIIMTNADNGGSLIWEVTRSVSAYYGWDLENPEYVELAVLDDNELDKLTGRYQLDEQVPGIGDYFVTVTREGKMLVVLDSNNGERNELYPMDALLFIDLEDGNKVEFSNDKGSSGFVWNNRARFIRND
jgi:CubicO group peptidase (beta-lactamase class C family)